MSFPLNQVEAATILSNMATSAKSTSNCWTQQHQSVGSNSNSGYLSAFENTSPDSNRLTSAVDSILLAKKQTVGSSLLLQDQQYTTDNSVLGEETSELNDCAHFFAHNDSSELLRSCNKKRRRDSDDYIELTPPGGDRRVTFDLPSSNWHPSSNQNLSEPNSADGQFMSDLIPLLEQVPRERKARIRDQLYRILVGELQMSLQTPFPSPPEEPSTWSPVINQTNRATPLPSFSLINSRDRLIYGNGNSSDVCRLMQSTPLTIGPAHNDLAVHFPLTESMHWSLEQYST